MRIELVHDEDPRRLRVGRDGLGDMGGEVRLRAGRPDAWGDHLAGGDLEVGDQTLGAVARVLEFLPLNLAWPQHQRRVQPLQGLHPALLVGADGANAGRLAGRRRLIRRTDVPDRGVEPVRVGRPVVGQPVSRTVRFELGLLCKKRPTVRAEMRGTMPRWTASAANSAGVQWVTGRPDVAGGSQASASSWQICSALKAGGAPARGASFNSAMMSLVRVASSLPSASAAAKRGPAASQRARQTCTVSRARPSRRASCSLFPPSLAARIIATRRTSRWGLVARRAKRSRSARWRGDKVNSGGRGPDMQPSASQARVESAAMLSSGQPRAQPPGY